MGSFLYELKFPDYILSTICVTDNTNLFVISGSGLADRSYIIVPCSLLVIYYYSLTSQNAFTIPLIKTINDPKYFIKIGILAYKEFLETIEV